MAVCFAEPSIQKTLQEELEPILGTYKYVPRRNDTQMIADQIERAIQSLSVFRYVARPKLQRGSAIDSMIELTYAKQKLSITHNNKIEKGTITVPIGQRVESRTERSLVHLVQWYPQVKKIERLDQASNGGRTIVYDFDGSGNTMEITVTMFSSRLSTPIEYTLLYKK